MKRLINSFSYAFQGLKHLFLTQWNARFHLFAAICAISLGFFLSLSDIEWVMVVICIGSVIGAEAINTAIETLCDALHPGIHPKIKIVKDVSAAAVLIISISSLISGCILFIPKIIILFNT